MTKASAFLVGGIMFHVEHQGLSLVSVHFRRYVKNTKDCVSPVGVEPTFRLGNGFADDGLIRLDCVL